MTLLKAESLAHDNYSNIQSLLPTRAKWSTNVHNIMYMCSCVLDSLSAVRLFCCACAYKAS